MKTTAEQRTEQRTARRMLRRSRSVWVSVALAVVAVAAGLVLLEAVLAALAAPSLVVSFEGVRSALTGGGTLGAVVAATAAVLGALCLWGAFSPGRTGRRLIGTDRASFVVDDDIVAGALSRGAARRAAVSPGQVSTHISRRRAEVQVTPSTGFVVPVAEVQRVEEEALAALALSPAVQVSVNVTAKGVLA